jgi:hypothetical protein
MQWTEIEHDPPQLQGIITIAMMTMMVMTTRYLCDRK